MNENGQPAQPDLAYLECPFEGLWHMEFGHFVMYLEPMFKTAPDDEGSEPELSGIRMRIVPSAPIGPGGMNAPVMPAPQVSLLFGIEYWRGAFKDAVLNDGKVPPPQRPTGIVVAGADQAPEGPFGWNPT